ncbi:alpha/beta fold hydrolase [Actinoplanes sp. NPDC051633]|uniref:alpha/beta fold hydrolase n=1 Tax=Actinoplanes sp. NPDC051633 TaxID=3155670 RepID=UPI00342B4A6B
MTVHHTAQLNGVKQHYVVAGSGPAVLLLHGWPQTWHEWRHVIDALAGDFTVVAPDLRGFGYSGKPASGYDAETYAADLAALLEHLDLHDVTVVGHDWGAVFGYVLAAAHPERVSALGIVEMALPGLGMMEQAMAPVADGNFLWHMGFQSVPDLPELLIAGKERPYLRWFFEHFAYDPSAITEADLDEYVAAITQTGALRAGLAVYQEFFRSAEQVKARSATPLDIPVRAYGGEACLGGLTLATAQAVAPAAEGGVIERCGHWAAEERPDFVSDLVRDLAKG